MARFTNVLMSVTGQSGALTGATYNMYTQDDGFCEAGINITAGTATVVIEGRNGPNDQWVVLDTQSATSRTSFVRPPQVRARLTAAAGATVLVTTSEPVRG
jgi:hypothetical protein